MSGSVLAGTGAFIYKSIADAFGNPVKRIKDIPSSKKLQAMVKLEGEMKQFALESGDISDGEKLMIKFNKLKGKKAKKAPTPNTSSESESNQNHSLK